MNCPRRIFLGLILAVLTGCTTTAMQPVADGKHYSYLALGDSYTIGRSVPEAGRWPLQLAAALRAAGRPVAAPRILARSGWTSAQLRNALGAVADSGPYDLVSVLIGVNDQYQGGSIDVYRRNLRNIFQRALALSRRGRRGVFVLSIPDYGATPFGAADATAIGRDIDRWNAACRAVAREFGLRFFDITGISRRGAGQESLVSFDRLHPSAAMYRLWVEAISDEVARMLDG